MSSIITLIKNDHKLVDQLWHQYDSIQKGSVDADLQKKQDLAWTIIHELTVHSLAEEEVLYPLLRTNLADGEKLYNHSLEEHQTIKNALYSLDQKTLSDPDYEPTLQNVMMNTLHHVREEETIVLPEFEKTVSTAQLIELGERFEAKKKTVPTRPHPMAPSSYPLNVMVNKLTAPLDKMRDAARFSESTTTPEDLRK